MTTTNATPSDQPLGEAAPSDPGASAAPPSETTLRADARLASLFELHAVVDEAVRDLESAHRDRLVCRRGCTACCLDGITVFEVEAERIRRAAPALLTSGLPHSEGACAFLDAEGACRIYADRPYVCRTQGLPLRWVEEGDAGELTESRDICPLNEEGPALVSLSEDACWTLGPVETVLATLATTPGSSTAPRVALRDLFRRSAAGER